MDTPDDVTGTTRTAPGARPPFAAWWRTTKKAINQWLDADDDRITRLVIVTGDDLGGVEALVRWAGDRVGAFGIADAWPVPEGAVASPDAAALAVHATPADVLFLAAPADAGRVDSLRRAHPEATVWWCWRPWQAAVAERITRSEDGGRAALDALAQGAQGQGSLAGIQLDEDAQDALADLLDHAVGPADAAALTWALRHEGALTPAVDRHVALDDPSRVAQALDAVGLSEAGPAWTAPPVDPADPPTVSPAIAARCDAVATALAGG